MNKVLKLLLVNAPAFNLERFDRDHNKIRGYSLYPPISITTIAASILKEFNTLYPPSINRDVTPSLPRVSKILWQDNLLLFSFIGK